MITINDITKHKNVTGALFRLVYNVNEAIVIIDGTNKSTTNTKHSVEEFNNKIDAGDRIIELGLTMSSDA